MVVRLHEVRRHEVVAELSVVALGQARRDRLRAVRRDVLAPDPVELAREVDGVRVLRVGQRVAAARGVVDHVAGRGLVAEPLADHALGGVGLLGERPGRDRAGARERAIEAEHVAEVDAEGGDRGALVSEDLAGEGLVVFEDVNVLKENVFSLDDNRFWCFLVTLRPMPWALRTAGVA